MNTENTFIVEGAGWYAQVEINPELFSDESSIIREAATRAVEALFNKRDDILITKMKDDADVYEILGISEENKKETLDVIDKKSDFDEKDFLEYYLTKEIHDEITPGCLIGKYLKIHNNDNTWYESSEIILKNVGLPFLLAKYNEKFPEKRKRGKPIKKSRRTKNGN